MICRGYRGFGTWLGSVLDASLGSCPGYVQLEGVPRADPGQDGEIMSFSWSWEHFGILNMTRRLEEVAAVPRPEPK